MANRRASWRMLGAILLGVALAFASPAHPTLAKTFYGSFHLGLQLGDLPGVNAEALPLQAMKLPFAGKLYYQDGMFRIDLDIPSSLTTDLPATGAAPSGPILKGSGFQVYTLLIPLEAGRITLIDHSARRAYSLIPPPEWTAQWKTPTGANPFEALKDPLVIQELAGQGVRITHTGRIKSETFNGLTTNAYEMKMKVKVPPEALKDMPADFKPIFTLQVYLEKDTGFPLRFSFLSDLFDFNFALANLKTDRLPESLFRIPQFYREKTFTGEELLELLAGLAGGVGSEVGKELEQLLKGVSGGGQPTVEGGTQETAASEEDEAEGGGKRFIRPAAGMLG